MKKLQVLLAALILMGSTTVVEAQQQPAPGQRGGGRNMMARMMEGITLSAEQQAKVDSIGKVYTDAREALRADQSLDRDARMAKGRELMTKQRDDIKALLTDEQKKVFEKNVADMDARMQQMGGQQQRPPRR